MVYREDDSLYVGVNEEPRQLLTFGKGAEVAKGACRFWTVYHNLRYVELFPDRLFGLMSAGTP